MPYIKYTDEQKRRAAAVDLEELLRRRGEKLLRSGPERRLASDHSVTVRGNEWFDHAAGVGGGPVKFIQQFYGLSYVDAMTMLLDGERGQEYPAARQKVQTPPKPFELPPANKDMRRVYAYLLKQRYIDRAVISHFAREGTLYEDAKYHNAVFAGKDEHGVFHHAHKRSTNTLGKSFRVNVEGSDPRYSFHHFGTDDQFYVFEAPIDMLSYITLHPEGWQEHSYVALCGTSDIAMRWMLEHKPELRDVALCLDHDEAGIEAAMKHRETLRELGYPDVRIIRPHCKDWNENLKELHGLPAQLGEEHPQLVAAGPICERIVQQSAGINGAQAPGRIPLLLRQYAANLRQNNTEAALLGVVVQRTHFKPPAQQRIAVRIFSRRTQRQRPPLVEHCRGIGVVQQGGKEHIDISVKGCVCPHYVIVRVSALHQDLAHSAAGGNWPAGVALIAFGTLDALGALRTLGAGIALVSFVAFGACSPGISLGPCRAGIPLRALDTLLTLWALFAGIPLFALEQPVVRIPAHTIRCVHSRLRRRENRAVNVRRGVLHRGLWLRAAPNHAAVGPDGG